MWLDYHRSLDSEIVVTLGYQLLPRHFNTLMFSSSLSNSFPKPIRWLTICVNLFCTSAIDSPRCILNNSCSWIKACFLSLFTPFVLSWVTSSTSHMSFALLHWKTLKNSSMFNEEVRIFLVVQSYWTRLLSSFVYRFHGLSTCLLSTCLGV